MKGARPGYRTADWRKVRGLSAVTTKAETDEDAAWKEMHGILAPSAIGKPLMPSQNPNRTGAGLALT